ncbi:hypothetical protein HDA40_006584 [Hamadaea flava]|uniref:Uncharacterized protein n=1 Tax=Hamadaea flava TaxID=1742688 RepID=A0ABV8LUD9_9ACTN|nr:hypothetical protein [Hamadaea flava]MCP2328077.1 hypothetical protein [Hamadaea flava]
MSSLASLFLLPVDRLPALATEATAPYDFLDTAAEEVDPDLFLWPGHGLVLTVLYLDEQGVDLADTRHRAEQDRLCDDWGYTLVLPDEHKRHLPALAVARYPADELRQYFATMGLDLDPEEFEEFIDDAFGRLDGGPWLVPSWMVSVAGATFSVQDHGVGVDLGGMGRPGRPFPA